MNKSLQDEIALKVKTNPTFAKKVHNSGFIELESSWGDEAEILNNARVSTSNTKIYNIKDIKDKDIKLLTHLLKNNHGTPFETLYFRFRIVMPLFVARQWIRHRISSFNEYSQRYRTPLDEFYIPDQDHITFDGLELLTDQDLEQYERVISNTYKFHKEKLAQMYDRIAVQSEAACPHCNSTGVFQGKIEIPEHLREECEYCKGTGKYPINIKGARARARELIRNVMPVATYTDLYWTVNFRSLSNFFGLRCDDHAQVEIRDYAMTAYEMVKKKYPILMDVYEEVYDKK
jgi:thymidylate synthase (FAD)